MNGNRTDVEKEFQEYVWKYCDLRLNTGNTVLRYLWQFLVTINLAYLAAFYFLKTNIELCTEQKIIWISILSGFVFIINVSLFVIYVREHNAITEHETEQKGILKKLCCRCKRGYEYPIWYFHNNKDSIKKDKLSGGTYCVIITLFLMFIIIPIFIVFYQLQPWFLLPLLFLIFYFCFYFVFCLKNDIEGSEINNKSCCKKIFSNCVSWKGVYIGLVASALGLILYQYMKL